MRRLLPFFLTAALLFCHAASALYMNAAYAGRKALVICTISDHVLTGEVTTPEERQTTFNHMVEVALDLL